MTSKHFVINIEYINDLALNIADNVPEEYYGKFCRELLQYLRCAITSGSDISSEDMDTSSDISDLEEEVVSVSIDENGFYSLCDDDVKDCNSVGKEEKNITEDKEEE